MLKSITFTKHYDLVLEKESQKRFPHKTIVPTRYMREKQPFVMFYLFKKGLKIEFHEGVNVIVGDNGSGKTTLFSLIKRYTGKPIDKLGLSFSHKYADEEDYFQKYRSEYQGELLIEGDISYRNAVYFDAEKDNPVVGIPKMLNPGSENFLHLSAELFFAQEESHGESMLPVITYILQNAKNCVIFMDEPETALSLRNQAWLVKELKRSASENHNQIIISTHALGVIQQFDTIFDMEARKWVKMKTYVRKMFK